MDNLINTIHSPSGWPFAIPSKEKRTKQVTVRHDDVSCSISSLQSEYLSNWTFGFCTLNPFYWYPLTEKPYHIWVSWLGPQAWTACSLNWLGWSPPWHTICLPSATSRLETHGGGVATEKYLDMTFKTCNMTHAGPQQIKASMQHLASNDRVKKLTSFVITGLVENRGTTEASVLWWNIWSGLFP